ncbi:MAG: hypothetical protein ACYSXF_02525 [Planctomycetota bacterium]|jgi:hypothetical protein
MMISMRRAGWWSLALAIALGGCGEAGESTTAAGGDGELLPGEDVPFYVVDGQTAMRFKIEIFVNGTKVAEALPPRQTLFMSTVNQYLKDGTNELHVDYEVVDVPEESADYGPPTFEVRVKQQPASSRARKWRTVVSVEGPTNGELAVGDRGTKKTTFKVKTG